MKHHKIIDDCIAGKTLERIPVALWRHFPVDDQTPENLAAATAYFQESYDFDLVKITPPSSFCLKDWGAQDRWTGNFEGTRDYTIHPIQSPEDWLKLKPLNPNVGTLGSQLRCLELLTSHFKGSVPLLQTIFSPLAQAKNLVGADNLVVHLRTYPEAVQTGLQVITETTIEFLKSALQTGVDGIFYAIQQARYDILSEDEFIKFGKSLDLQVLEIADQAVYRMLHIHGENVMSHLVKDYPVNIFNWHDRHTSPDLRQAIDLFPGALCGGLRRWETMTLGSPQNILNEAEDAIQQTDGKRLILGTGCVMPIYAPHGNIKSLVQFAKNRKI